VGETINPFELRDPEEAAREVKGPQIHVYGPSAVCSCSLPATLWVV
jgi:hypothetical protein